MVQSRAIPESQSLWDPRSRKPWNCLSRGADIAFLSVYPTEQEALYPPLTYLRCLEMKMETVSGVQLLVAAVEPIIA